MGTARPLAGVPALVHPGHGCVRSSSQYGLLTSSRGAILAIFNASLAITLWFARVTYASGRDMAWPAAPISNAYANLLFKMPWVATMTVGVLGAILCSSSACSSVVTFTAVLIIILYA